MAYENGNPEEFDVLDSADLVTWCYDNLFAADWRYPTNPTQGVSPAEGILIVSGPHPDSALNHQRVVLVPSRGMTGFRTQELMSRALIMLDDTLAVEDMEDCNTHEHFTYTDDGTPE